MYRVAVYFLLVGVTLVTALEPFDNFREGNCAGVPVEPVKASREFVDSLKYISAGSRYHMYRSASSLPNYKSLTEDEFYYDFCYGRNISTQTPESIGASFGFGRLLSTFHVIPRPGVYLEAIPRCIPNCNWDTLRSTVTLTDNKSFAFITGCWTGVDQRVWNIVTLTPNIDARTRRVIEDHAVSLGFKRENFVFLRYDSCKWGSPIFDEEKGPSGPVTPVPVRRFGRRNRK